MSPAPSRILVLRRRALGDLVASLPALADLRAAYPRAEIHLVMDPAWVSAAQAWAPVDRVLSLPQGSWGRVRFALALRRARYDLVIDLLSTPQTAILSWLAGAPRRAGLALAGRSWAYTERVVRPGSATDPSGRPTYLGDAMRDVMAAALPAEAGRRGRSAPARRARHAPLRVAIAPGSTWSAKAWPPASYTTLAQLALSRWHAEVTVFWGPGEEALARGIVEGAPGARLAPPGTIVELGERLAACDLLFSGDSGARHLAQYLGLATVSVFGPTDPWTQTPRGGDHRFLRYPVACAPCQLATCPFAHNYCLTRLSPEEVFDVADALVRAGNAA